MRTLFIALLSAPSIAGLSSCAAPILIGQDPTNSAVRSSAFGPYPEVDQKRCEALTQEEADQLYNTTLATGRCNPNNHHWHDGDHNHDHIEGDEG